MTKKSAKLLKAGSLYFIGNIFDKAVAFITVPIFTRMLSTSDYGVISTYSSWVSILTVIITLSLGNSIRSAVIDFRDDQDGYMSAVFTLGTISAVWITGIICFISFVAGIDQNLFKLILCCCAQAYAASVLQAVQWKYMLEVKYLQKTIIQSIPNIIAVVMSICLICQMQQDKYWGRIYASVIVYSVLSICYVFVYCLKGKKYIHLKYWKYALGFSLPIIFHSLSTVILSQADRSMITWLRSSSDTGIYSLAYQFGMVPQVFTTTFENVWIPWFNLKMQTNDKPKIREFVKPYINTVAFLCSGIMLVAPEVLKMMTTKEYYAAVYIIAPVIMGVFLMFLASISLDLEYYLKKTKTIAANTLIAGVLNLLLNYIFIPNYGAIAAAYTTVVSYGASFLLHYTVAKKIAPGLFEFRCYIPSLLLVTVFTVLTNLLMDLIIIRWCIGGIIGIVFVLYLARLLKLKTKL